MISPGENAGAFSPGISLGRAKLPWATPNVRQTITVRPERARRARGCACAKGAVVSIVRDAGTSVIAKRRSASGRSGGGRRHAGKQNADKITRSGPGTPSRNARAARGPRLRPRSDRSQMLRRRVVTQQKDFFSPPLCDRPGCHEPPAVSVRNPARYCCVACRQAVRNVQDRERKWRVRGTSDGRLKRAYEYQAARRRRPPPCPIPPTAPPFQPGPE
jgi:hypothetical protein